ncbi:MAG: outer membrane beta-barrel protein, partial [Rhizomicrobium sp.]
VQFYVQAGLYSFPTVGAPYEKSSDEIHDTFGYVPIAYLKLQLNDEFSIQAGKLPTLIGAELPTTVQNINIERGLLWFQEPLVSRGVQVNYASGPLSISLSWNDGLYSNVWNTFSGLISYSMGDAGTLAFDSSITPARDFVPASQIYNLMYSVTSGAWYVGPYAQYQHFDATKAGGLTLAPSASDWGIGVLANYTIDPNWSVGLRGEYEDSSGHSAGFIYGPGSNAWSFTVTPTWKKGIFFIRGEASYTTLGSYFKFGGTGAGFGKFGTKSDQFRGLLEAGIVF